MWKFSKCSLIVGLLFNYNLCNALEIIEVFSFSCSHCYSVEPQLQSLSMRKDIQITSIPLYNPNNIDEVATISAFFAAKSLGKEWQFRQTYFTNVFRLGYPVYSGSTLKYSLTQIGLDNQQFYKLASSPIILNQMRNAANQAIKYNVSGTPTFIVNGQFYEGEDGLQKIFN